MSNSTPTSPKPTTGSAQNSPSGWTTAQPATKPTRERNYASPTASSGTTTGRAKSRTLDSTTTKTTTTTGATKEKKVTLRRNTEKSLSPTPAVQSGWVSARKGAKATTPPPSTTPRRSSSSRSVSQDESSLTARLENSSVINDMKKTGTTTEALDLLSPTGSTSSASRMKRSVSDADLAFEAAAKLREQISTGQPFLLDEAEHSEEEHHEEEHEEEEEEVEEGHSQDEEQTETTHEAQEHPKPEINIQLPQINVKEPEPEHHQEPKVEETQHQHPRIEIKEPAPVQHTPHEEPTPKVENTNKTPQEQQVTEHHKEVVAEVKHQEPASSHHEVEPHPTHQPTIEHHEPSIPHHPEPVVVKEAHLEAKQHEEHVPHVHVESESTPVVHEAPVQHQPAEQPQHQSLQQTSISESKPHQEQQSLEPTPAAEVHLEPHAPIVAEVLKEPTAPVQVEVPKQEPEKNAAQPQNLATESQENDSLQFAMEPEQPKEVPSSPKPAPVQEQPKSMAEVMEQQQMQKRLDEENRRKALIEQEDKIKRSVQDKIQKALEERRKQVLSPTTLDETRRKSFDANDLSTSAPMAPSPMTKPPSDPNLPVYIRQPPSPLSSSAPGPPSILSSSPGGSKKDFKRVSFNFEDGRILYPGTDGHLDLVTHTPKKEKEEKEKEKSPEKQAPLVTVTAPVEQPKSPEKSVEQAPVEKTAPASPTVTVTAPASTTSPASNPTSPSAKDEAKQAALAEKRKSINDRIQLMLKPENPTHVRRRSFDERDAEELKTIRQQQDQRLKEEEEKNKQFHESRAKEFEEQKKKQIEEFKKQQASGGSSSLYEREAQEEQERLQRLRENKPVNQSDDPNLKGFDAELSKKMSASVDPSWEYNACKWVEQLSGESVYDAGECLYTGIVLCKLINAIKPNMIAKFYSKPIALMQTENIKLYLQACQQLGVSKDDLFSVSDLHSRKNMKAVISNIYALARNVQNQPDWKGPTLLNAGPAPPTPAAKPVSKSVAIPIVPTRDRAKTEDLPNPLKSSAPEFRDRARTAGAKLSSNVPDLQHEVITLREELEALRKQLADKDKVIKVLKPPKWRPDEDVERCTLCATEFSFFNRRHHCRQCGEIFCTNCCSKSFELQQLNKQLQKVCNRCFIDLQQFQTSMGSVLDSWNVY